MEAHNQREEVMEMAAQDKKAEFKYSHDQALKDVQLGIDWEIKEVED